MVDIKDKPTNDPDKLSKLIQNGDAEMLLAEGDLGKGFNKLIQLDLISIEDGEVKITPRGEEALEKGVDALAPKEVQVTAVQPAISNNSFIKTYWNRKMWLLAILLLLFMMVLLASQMLV